MIGMSEDGPLELMFAQLGAMVSDTSKEELHVDDVHEPLGWGGGE